MQNLSIKWAPLYILVFGVLDSLSSPKVPMWLKIQVPPKHQQLSGLGNGTGALISFHHRCQACHQRDSSLTHGSHIPDHAPPGSIKQETSERQKGSPQLLLSNQAIANYKELTHTSLQVGPCPTSAHSVAHPGVPAWPSRATSQPLVLMLDCQLLASTFVVLATTCFSTTVETWVSAW